MVVSNETLDLDSLIRGIDKTLLNVDVQKNQLEGFILKFSTSLQGESLIVSGSRASGRMSLINQCLKSVRKLSDVEVLHMDICMIGTDSNALQSLVDEQSVSDNNGKNAGRSSVPKNAKVIIVKGADELASRSKQVLLYKLLNATHTLPWLVILIVDRQDFLQCLEKRVRSRISSKKVIMESSVPSIEKYKQGFYELMSVRSTGVPIAKALSSSALVNGTLQTLFEVDCRMCLLKRVVCVFLGFLHGKPSTLLNDEKEVEREFALAAELCLPSDHHILSTVESLSLRIRCILLCILRRLRYQRSHDACLTYRKIVTDYKHLCNNADSRLGASDDVLYKGIDKLGELRVVDVLSAAHTNSAFRRVVLCCDNAALADALLSTDVPTSIRLWYETQPTV